MAKINDGVLRNWSNGETVDEASYERDFEILRVANNDNHERIESNAGGIGALDTRTSALEADNDVNKANIVDLQDRTGSLEALDLDTKGAYALTQGDYAKTQGDYAKAEADRLVGTDVSVLETRVTEHDTLLAEIALQAKGYSKLQNAIDDATTKGRPLLINGTYNEPLTDLNITCKEIRGDAFSQINVNSITISSSCKISGVKIVTSSGNSITLSNQNDVEMNNCDISTSATTGNFMSILATNCKNLKLIGNKIKKGGVETRGCQDLVIQGNTIDGEWLNNNELIHATLKSSGNIINNLLVNSNLDFIDVYSAGEKMIISDNRCIGSLNNGIEIKTVLSDDTANTSSDVNGWIDSVIVSNNLISNVRGSGSTLFSGIHNIFYDLRATKTFDLSKMGRPIIIQGNIIEDINTDLTGCRMFGIYVSTPNALINGNIIKNVKKGSAPYSGGIFFANDNAEYVSDITVSNNVIVGVDQYGIYGTTFKNANIMGNKIGKDYETNVLPDYGIYATSVEGSKVSQNMFEFGIRGINITTSTLDSDISHNKFKSTNQASGMGIYLIYAKNTNVIGNMSNIQFRCDRAEKLSFHNNKIIAPLSTAFFVGAVANQSTGIVVTGNTVFNTNTGNGVYINNASGFIVKDNVFDTMGYAIVAANESMNGTIKDNIAYNHTQTNLVLFATVSAGNQATTIQDNNKRIS